MPLGAIRSISSPAVDMRTAPSAAWAAVPAAMSLRARIGLGWPPTHAPYKPARCTSSAMSASPPQRRLDPSHLVRHAAKTAGLVTGRPPVLDPSHLRRHAAKTAGLVTGRQLQEW